MMSHCAKRAGAPGWGWAWISRQGGTAGAIVHHPRGPHPIKSFARFLQANAAVDLASRVPPRLKDKVPDPAGKPPVVILHGMLGSASNWRSVISRKDFFGQPNDYVCAIDLRNHGQSQHAPTMSYEEMCNDVDAFSRKMGVRSAHLIGHSMGGKVAMTLALKYPERVASLCVVDIAPVDYNKTAMHVSIMDAMIHLDLEHVRDMQTARKALKDNIPDPMTREFIMTNLAMIKDLDGSPRLKWKVNIEALRKGVTGGDLAKFPGGDSAIYDGPTLFVRGGRSEYVKEDHFGSIVELFPNSEIKTIEGAGHWVHHEKQDDFVRTLNEWYEMHY